MSTWPIKVALEDPAPWTKLAHMDARIRFYFKMYPNATVGECVIDVGCTSKDAVIVLGADTPHLTSQNPRPYRHRLCAWCALTVPKGIEKRAVAGVTGFFHHECEVAAQEFNT